MVRWLQLKFALWTDGSSSSTPPSLTAGIEPPDPTSSAQALQRYRAIFISDIHLGTRGCKAAFLLDFLRHNESDTLYLVGDIIDGWALKKSFH
jgi:hypothetical protein